MIRKSTGSTRRKRKFRSPLADIDCDIPPLSECVRRSIQAYFKNLNGHSVDAFYEVVLTEIEKPLLEVVMSEVKGNLSRASEVLGLNRATLRKKLRKYGVERIE